MPAVRAGPRGDDRVGGTGDTAGIERPGGGRLGAAVCDCGPGWGHVAAGGAGGCGWDQRNGERLESDVGAIVRCVCAVQYGADGPDVYLGPGGPVERVWVTSVERRVAGETGGRSLAGKAADAVWDGVQLKGYYQDDMIEPVRRYVPKAEARALLDEFKREEDPGKSDNGEGKNMEAER